MPGAIPSHRQPPSNEAWIDRETISSHADHRREPGGMSRPGLLTWIRRVLRRRGDDVTTQPDSGTDPHGSTSVDTDRRDYDASREEDRR